MDHSVREFWVLYNVHTDICAECLHSSGEVRHSAHMSVCNLLSSVLWCHVYIKTRISIHFICRTWWWRVGWNGSGTQFMSFTPIIKKQKYLRPTLPLLSEIKGLCTSKVWTNGALQKNTIYDVVCKAPFCLYIYICILFASMCVFPKYSLIQWFRWTVRGDHASLSHEWIEVVSRIQSQGIIRYLF